MGNGAKLLLMIFVGILLIEIGLTGRLGSILAAVIAPEYLVAGTPPTTGIPPEAMATRRQKVSRRRLASDGPPVASPWTSRAAFIAPALASAIVLGILATTAYNPVSANLRELSKRMEAELFGYRRGAFSGAVEDHPGLVRGADRGTLLLDEIGDLPLANAANRAERIQSRWLPSRQFAEARIVKNNERSDTPPPSNLPPQFA